MTTLSRSVVWRRIVPGGPLPSPGELVWFARNSGARLVKCWGWTPALWLGPTDNPWLAAVHMEGRVLDRCHVSRFHWGDEPPTRSRP